MTEVLDRARAWLDEDPDPDTRAELAALLERADAADRAAVADVADRFAGKLEFGTAGLRGTLGAGPNRMNRAVVIRAAAGLAAYLRAHGGSSVVVGYDARHKSDQFARDTCAVMVGAGLRAMVLPRPLPTPVLAFAIRHLGADAGVMVTASHNPPQDNGYKVYLGDGAQIVPPTDTEISAAIDAVGALDAVPLADAGWQTLDETLLDAYVARAAAVARPAGPREVAIVYTPLHGVGGEVMRRVLEATGFPHPAAVEQQADPDPDFPTVPFPNPEEPGAIDLALELAARSSADLVIANDPDADRCAVAAPTPDGWRMLRGDEVGALLATYLIAREPGLSGVFACSIVSSSLLGKIAGRHGIAYAETLTGFKWIGRIDGLRFGYEEALGYCVDPDAVRDKDGVSAAVLIAELAATLRAEGRGLTDALDDIARGYGLHATDQLAVRVADLAQIDTVMERLRTAPPSTLGGRTVEEVDDLSLGVGGLPPT
ncbi:MAG TPA: phospho-sugar mutase, partial [Jiangellaceae bacterium]